MEQVRIAVIGIGAMGSVHAGNLYNGAIEGAALAAVCDADPERLAWAERELRDTPVYADYRALLAAGLADAVIVATPHYGHCPIGSDCFAAGLHVLCEKPIGVYAAQADGLLEAARRAGTVFSVMFNQRTEPLYRAVRRLLSEGTLGELQRLSWTVTNWYRTQEYYDSGVWRATWDGEGGGVLLNQAVHNLDLWQWLFGMPEQLTAFCRFGRYHDIEVEDDVTIYAAYAGGASAVFTASTGEFPGTNRLEIAGSAGKLVAEGGGLTLWRAGAGRTESTPETVPVEESGPVGHNAVLQNFVNAIREGEPLIAPGAEGLRSLELINAALLSAWEGRTVSLPADRALYLARLNERRAASRRGKPSGKAPALGSYSPRWDIHW